MANSLGFSIALRKARDRLRDFKERTSFCDENALDDAYFGADALHNALNRAPNNSAFNKAVRLQNQFLAAILKYKTRCKCRKR